MKAADLNVLLYAVNVDAARRAAMHAWWEGTLNGAETAGLAWIVLLGFLRISRRLR